MRRTLIAALILSGTLTALLLVARAAGAAAPPIAAQHMLRPDECPPPCWHGITPGKTMLERAESLLIADRSITIGRPLSSDGNLRQICWSVSSWLGCAYRSGYAGLFSPVILIEINPPSGSLRLGDAILMYGGPEAGRLCVRSITRSRGYLSASIFFPGGLEMRAYHPLHPSLPRFEPDMIVYSVRYHYVTLEPPYRFDTPTWRGFVSSPTQKGC